MRKNMLVESVLTPIFKLIFKGKVKSIGKAINSDPVLKEKTKELSIKVKEISDYIDENFGGYGGNY